MCFGGTVTPAPVVSEPAQVTPPRQTPEGSQTSQQAGDSQRRRVAAQGQTISTSPLGITAPAQTTSTISNRSLLG